MTTPRRFGVVVIGRNEGERLRRCLESVATATPHVLYVDSGSVDGSAEYAEGRGIPAVRLDTSTPFTAARARNAGLAALLVRAPDLEFVQFVDGDCEVAPAWLATAAAALAAEPALAVVCGRRRERERTASIYNRLCDLEWNTPIGLADACGGDAMMRIEAFRAAGGFDPELIAGEEPDLCARMRARGHRIRRLDAEMTLHDAAMTRFGQWWRRLVRAGHASAEHRQRHGAADDASSRRVRSCLFWGGVLPVVCGLAVTIPLWTGRPLLAASIVTGLAALYVVQLLRIARHRRRQGDSPADAFLYGFFCLLGKLPELQGVLSYFVHRGRGTRRRLIEYKTAAPVRAVTVADSPGKDA